MIAAIERCQLDLAGRVVLTEAATGAYAVTPVLAALAGAQVYALAAGTRYATPQELAAGTAELARLAGVADQIELIPAKTPGVAGAADIVTNSGQVRPIDAAMVGQLKPSAVIPLMYESWEYRGTDVDLEACRGRGIPVAGTNETHPAVGVFSFLGPMAVKQLHDAGIAVYDSDIVLLCDADRAAAAAAGVPVWPPEAPPPGHMGVLPSAVGPEPIVRLQAGGLKVGEVLARGLDRASAADLAFVQAM